MAAYEEGIPVDEESEQRQRSIMDEYKKKLIVNGEILPDPFSLKDDWLAEKKGTGMSKWPSVYYMNIERFLCKINDSSDLLMRLESEYKEGKAYRYFKCEFVKEIFYHNISLESPYCVLKSRVTPSQRTSNTAYHVWAIIEKDGKKPGGKIHSAYCTCTAGLLGCCNHVTAMLFRVEAAVISGATKPSSTSMLACWNVPTGCKTKLVHKPIVDMTFTKHHYKSGEHISKKIASSNKCYQNYNVAGREKSQILQNENLLRESLYNALKEDACDSCFIELMEGVRKTKPKGRKTLVLPPGIKELASTFQIDENCSQEENIKKFTNSLHLSEAQIADIEEATREQSSSNDWFTQREGRITASNFHKIFTRIETLKKKPGENIDNLLQSVINAKKFETFASDRNKIIDPIAS